MVGNMTQRARRTILVVVGAIVLCLALVACSGGDAALQSTPSRTAPTAIDELAVEQEVDNASVDAPGEMAVTTSAFAPGGEIPVIFARPGVEGGANVSIPYEWSGVPAGTQSCVLVLVDLHQFANEWNHWVVVDIPPDSVSLPEGASRIEMPDAARELNNSFGESGYGGPQPPAGSGNHEYRATIYALDMPSLEIGESPDHATILAAIEGHVLAKGSVSGLFGR